MTLNRYLLYIVQMLTYCLILVPRNFDPDLHLFEGAREYARALNAVKMDKIFAKPFIGSLDGHREGITVLGKHPKILSSIGSGAYDGEVSFHF